MNEISRIETVDPGRIQEIDSDQFINIAGKTVRIVRPENYVPVKKHSYTTEKLYLLTLKKSESSIGFLAGKVFDKVTGCFEFDDKQFYSDYIFGTSRFDEKILIFLNPVPIAESIENDKQKKSLKRGDVA